MAQNYIEHENGRRRILSFHGRGTVFPGYHGRDYRIERSIVTRAVSEMEVLEFTRAQFAAMFEENAALRRIQLDWYATYVNLLLYDAAHQEFNSARIQLCNLLYLLQGGEADPQRLPDVTQDELSDILGMSRVNLARTLAQPARKGSSVHSAGASRFWIPPGCAPPARWKRWTTVHRLSTALILNRFPAAVCKNDI